MGSTGSFGGGGGGVPGGGGGSGVGLLVYQEAGPTNKVPVFNDWATLYAYAEAQGVPVEISFDYEFATPTIPAGSWNFTKPVYLSGPGSISAFINLASGCVLSNTAVWTDLIITTQGVPADGAAVQPVGTQNQVTLDRCLIQGNRPFISGQNFFLRLINTQVQGGSNVLIENVGFAFIFALISSFIPPNRLGGNGFWFLGVGPDSGINANQPSATGTLNYQYQDLNQQRARLALSAVTIEGRQTYIFDTSFDLPAQSLPDPSRVFGPLTIRNRGTGTISLTNGTVIQPNGAAILRSDGTVWIEMFTQIGFSAFSFYKETDQPIAIAETAWDLSGESRLLNDGYTIDAPNGRVTPPTPGRYEVTATAGQSNNSGFSGTIRSILRHIRPASTNINLSASTFQVIEIDGVGDRSGGSVLLTSIVDIEAGQSLEFVSSGTVLSLLENTNITIKRL